MLRKRYDMTDNQIPCTDNQIPYLFVVYRDTNAEHLAAWKEGRTGFPWIDACMIQLQRWVGGRIRGELPSAAKAR